MKSQVAEREKQGIKLWNFLDFIVGVTSFDLNITALIGSCRALRRRCRRGKILRLIIFWGMITRCKRESLVLVDGYNLYHSLRAIEKDTGHKVRWMDVRKLSELLINRLILPGVPYPHILFFTAYAEHNGNAHVTRQKEYHQCLKRLGIDIVCDGTWSQKDVPIAHHFDSLWWPLRPFMKKRFGMFCTPVEKGTDISIAAHLMHLGPQAKSVCLISGDSDLLPAVNLFRAANPTVRFGVARPYKRENRKLNLPNCTNISVDDCLKCLLPDPAPTKNRKIQKPSNW